MIMDVLAKIKGSFRWSYDYDSEGYAITRADGTLNGHDVQIIQEDGSKMCTVFVDGEPVLLHEDRVQGHITAKVRR